MGSGKVDGPVRVTSPARLLETDWLVNACVRGRLACRMHSPASQSPVVSRESFIRVLRALTQQLPNYALATPITQYKIVYTIYSTYNNHGARMQQRKVAYFTSLSQTVRSGALKLEDWKLKNEV